MDTLPMSVKARNADCDAQASQNTLKQCTETKDKAKSPNCGGSHASVYKRCFSYQDAFVEATKREQDMKYSAVAKIQPKMLHPNSTVSVLNMCVLVAEVFSKIQSTFNIMSYSDIINVVIVSASRIFGDKIKIQKIHDSIKNATNTFANVPTQRISRNSHQFNQHGLN